MWLIEEHIVLHQIEKYCAKFRNCIAQPAAQRHICDGIWVSKCVCMWCSTDALATQLSTDCNAGTRQMTSIPIGWNKEKLKESEIERERKSEIYRTIPLDIYTNRLHGYARNESRIRQASSQSKQAWTIDSTLWHQRFHTNLPSWKKCEEKFHGLANWLNPVRRHHSQQWLGENRAINVNGLTGCAFFTILNNYHNWCFINSLYQATVRCKVPIEQQI